MKILELKQMVEFVAGKTDCATAEGVVAGTALTAWILGPIGYSIALSLALTYWTENCGSADY